MRLYDIELTSPLMLGTSRYPSPVILGAAVRASNAQVVTVSLRREAGGELAGQRFWSLISELGVRVLPNTAGCQSVKEAVTTAHMGREVFATDWVKLEVVGGDVLLEPDVFGLVEAAKILCEEGFKVFPYTTEDLGVADRLLRAGCRVLMPWGSPIGSARGLNNEFGLRALRVQIPEVPLIIDAGLGLPSQAAHALELGFDGVLVNTGVAKAGDPVQMATAFARAVEAGLLARAADPLEPRDWAQPSTPTAGRGQLW